VHPPREDSDKAPGGEKQRERGFPHFRIKSSGEAVRRRMKAKKYELAIFATD